MHDFAKIEGIVKYMQVLAKRKLVLLSVECLLILYKYLRDVE